MNRGILWKRNGIVNRELNGRIDANELFVVNRFLRDFGQFPRKTVKRSKSRQNRVKNFFTGEKACAILQTWR